MITKAKRGAPLGNRNAAKGNRIWADTIRRVVTQENSRRLRTAAEKLIALAEDGDVPALRELGDRLDGKPAQAIVGAEGGPVQVQDVPWLLGRTVARR